MLNAWLARGPDAHRALRRRLSELLTDERYRDDVELHLIGQSEVRMHLPCLIGDYTDFYVGIHHATNVGKQFRPDNPLLPNYKYVPIGYHGRASSVRAVGRAGRSAPTASASRPMPTRPNMARAAASITSSSSACGSAAATSLGQPIPIGEAGEHIAGYCLLNDWSARDLQAWEYQPLGPFLAKNFLTSVSPWVVTRRGAGAVPQADAAAAGTAIPQPLPYLDDAADRATRRARRSSSK